MFVVIVQDLVIDVWVASVVSVVVIVETIGRVVVGLQGAFFCFEGGKKLFQQLVVFFG